MASAQCDRHLKAPTRARSIVDYSRSGIIFVYKGVEIQPDFLYELQTQPKG
jgi:hypothetical protein